MQTLFTKEIHTPLGRLMAIADEQALYVLTFMESVKGEGLLLKMTRNYLLQREDEGSKILRMVMEQLEEYFEGVRQEFTVPFYLDGSEFQKKIWQKLLEIPYGNTTTYQKQSLSCGNPAAVRAVASANGANPILLLLPCHRVVGKRGELRGYAGGLEAKSWLLNHEKVHSGKILQQSLFIK